MSDTIQAALLGVVQGLTEFLPVSSSAHLILARTFFGFDSDKFGLSFDVACHMGTLLAVLVYFREDLAKMIAALPQALGARPPEGGHSVQPGVAVAVADREPRLIWLLVVGTIPAVIVGLLFGKVIEERMRTPSVAAVALAAGAILMFVAERSGRKTRDEVSLTMAE